MRSLFNPLPMGLTTAATDLLLGVICLALWMRFRRTEVAATWRRTLWYWVFGLLTFSSLLGAVAHGFHWTARVYSLFWYLLYPALGLTVALFFVAAVHDWRGPRAARTLLPWAIGIGLSIIAMIAVFDTAFVIFTLYEAVAMVAALAMYLLVWRERRLAGAGTIALGIAVTIAAAAVQASSASVTLIVPFDHNGLYHLVQIAGTVVIAAGVRAGLEASVPRPI